MIGNSDQLNLECTNQTELNEKPFVCVQSKRQRARARKGVAAEVQEQSTKSLNFSKNHLIDDLEDREIDEAAVLRKISESRILLAESEIYKQILSIIAEQSNDPPTSIVCFGIGHFTDCIISRHQLALCLLLKDEFNIKSITFHEPLLRKGEVKLLTDLNCSVYAENIEGKYTIDPQALVYLPHCPKQLTNNFLWKNWNNLSGITFICNSFSNLLDSTPKRFLEIDANYILQIQPFTKEFKLRNNFKYLDIFNDTSVHYFGTKDFANSLQEPVYQSQSELITTDLLAKLNLT